MANIKLGTTTNGIYTGQAGQGGVSTNPNIPLNGGLMSTGNSFPTNPSIPNSASSGIYTAPITTTSASPFSGASSAPIVTPITHTVPSATPIQPTTPVKSVTTPDGTKVEYHPPMVDGQSTSIQPEKTISPFQPIQNTPTNTQPNTTTVYLNTTGQSQQVNNSDLNNYISSGMWSTSPTQGGNSSANSSDGTTAGTTTGTTTGTTAGTTTGTTGNMGFTIPTTNSIGSSALSASSPNGYDAYAYLRGQQNMWNAYQNAYNTYAPQITALSTPSQQEMQLQQQIYGLDQGTRLGQQNILGETIPVEYQQGEAARLQAQSALRQQGLAEQLSLMQQQRINQLNALNTSFGLQKDMFGQYGTTLQNMFNSSIQQQQLGLQQQQVAQGQYQFETITNPQTGLPSVIAFNKSTGQQVDLSNGGSVSYTEPTNGVIQGVSGNYDFSSYATDPTKPAQVQSITTGIINANATETPGALNKYIQSIAPNSPITGNMILSSAQKYGVDPAVLAANIQQESQFGTAGIGAKTNNPGNIGNTDGGATKTYPSVQAGIDATAQWMAQHKADTTPQATDTTVTPQQFNQVVQAAPLLIRSSIRQLPDGTPYIDGGQLTTPAQQSVAQTFAGNTGIHYISADDAKAIETLKQSLDNLNVISSTFSNLAPKTAGGKFADTALNWASKTFNTDFGSKLKAYQTNRDSLFQQIRALAGSSPRINQQELDLAANALPNLTGTSKDTMKDGINKLVKTQNYLDNAIRSLDPNYLGTPIAVGNQFAVLGNDGNAYIFADKGSAMQFLSKDR